MKIAVTANELMSRGYWDRYCEATGTNIWAVNEGQLDGDELIDMSTALALEIGLINKEWLNT